MVKEYGKRKQKVVLVCCYTALFKLYLLIRVRAVRLVSCLVRVVCESGGFECGVRVDWVVKAVTVVLILFKFSLDKSLLPKKNNNKNSVHIELAGNLEAAS